MEQRICKLTLVYPPAAEESIVNFMLTREPPLAGFTTLAADGHGVDFADATANELVRGRVRRGLMLLILPWRDATGLLEQIRTAIAVPRLAYWIEPVEAFGRLL